MDLETQNNFRSFLSHFEPDRPIVFFNNATLSCPVKLLNPDTDVYTIPKEILDAAKEPYAMLQCAAISVENISMLGVSLEERVQFSSGAPILVWAKLFQHREPRPRGGQIYDEIELSVRDALAVTTYLVVERIRLILRLRAATKSHIATEVARHEVIENICHLAPSKGMHANFDDLYRHLWTLFNNGQRSKNWQKFFNTTDQKKAIKAWASNFISSSKLVVDSEISFQQSLLFGLLTCEERAETQRRVINEVSDLAIKNKNYSIGQHAELAAVSPSHRVGVSDVLNAAFCSNVNPADLYPNLENSRVDFETMIQIGRLSRGLEAHFKFKHIIVLLSSFKLLELYPNDNAFKDVELLFWAQAMGAVMDTESWRSFIKLAYPDTKKGLTASFALHWEGA